MEAFRDQFTTTELLLYKEVLYEEATESGLRNVIQTNWTVKTATAHVLLNNSVTLWKRTENGFSHMYSFNHQHEA